MHTAWIASYLAMTRSGSQARSDTEAKRYESETTLKKRPLSSESGRFYPIFTDNHSFRFRKKTLLPPAVVEKTKVFGSVLFE